MDYLEVPNQLKGSWQHALIITYGADLSFFERSLWRQFSAKCRNKVILADGQRFLEGCLQYAESGLIRHLNQLYVAEGVFTQHAAHAKLILLTNATRGRLLIGSGNLGWQGYASGGEQFSLYEYDSQGNSAVETLNAFLTVKDFLEALINYGYVTGHYAVRRIWHLLSKEQTPWLHQAPIGGWLPVRHNLDDSFLSQLKQVVGDRPVKELWVSTPFYDKRVVALRMLLETFQPVQATLLVQSGYTSVDPAELQNVLDDFPHCKVHVFTKGDDNPYVHAKLYLLKLTDQAICLQGSEPSPI